ncbi:hypothetical protein CRG98_012810 [Punica granatum]|uniref:Uncharacterized protein n=1 Tax=Punica granatum TaxID=22663 RepID=A0A2I0KE61_PUNGR|nr:hypothetical protein CRG98_012810 [Punica granatum]
MGRAGIQGGGEELSRSQNWSHRSEVGRRRGGSKQCPHILWLRGASSGFRATLPSHLGLVSLTQWKLGFEGLGRCLSTSGVESIGDKGLLDLQEVEKVLSDVKADDVGVASHGFVRWFVLWFVETPGLQAMGSCGGSCGRSSRTGDGATTMERRRKSRVSAGRKARWHYVVITQES